MTELAVGKPAPALDLETDDGAGASLSGYAGRPVVVYFYPKDDTSGCTLEAIDFTALADAFAGLNAVVVGVSPDSCTSHAKFRAKHGLGVVLAADPDKTTLERWGVWREKSMYGRKYMGVERTTVLVGPDGHIVRVWNKVKVPGHAAEVLAAVRELVAA